MRAGVDGWETTPREVPRAWWAYSRMGLCRSGRVVKCSVFPVEAAGRGVTIAAIVGCTKLDTFGVLGFYLDIAFFLG